jgi:hypothetical protein
MILSELQRYVLRTAYRYPRVRVPRQAFADGPRRSRPVRHSAEILSRSLERLIDRGLLIGFGHRTSDKWFIESVRLTTLGRRHARAILSAQASLPLK